MAVCITNRSNVLTNSSVASLERAVCSGDFLWDNSKDSEFNDMLKDVLDGNLAVGTDIEFEKRRWADFFDFMPDDNGGIMSHINTLMKQKHAHLLHEWKEVDGHTPELERLIGNVKRFRDLCKDFRIQDREYNCFTSNFLVEKPRGLRMHEHPFFMTARMMRKLRICRANYKVIELTDKYELLENFLLHDGGHFEDTFKLGSTVVQLKSIKNPSIYPGKTVVTTVHSEILPHPTQSIRVVPRKFNLDLNFNSLSDSDENLNSSCDLDIEDDAEIKFMGRVLSCLKHMSNYNDEAAQFGVIDNLCKVGCDNFIVAISPTIDQILDMKPTTDLVLVDLSMLSDVPIIFGTDLFY